ncbi:UDP-glucose/GDP-mannose dehydrogenase family protein [Paenibacillus sp. H1-7]|uniref:UDP-glucose dehydrogenase family protein n=1 Tax=Paenibacillus sp. H1-7 TaxID=2282849 RepID=UPI001EF7B30E|nr:UDP-glucose/GDP-mannose dehydrogenase family protein [Paenibacillus sp. H1-7]ULL16996.1 UDP-glucose/GDP-mannose dehydrogenase family protein [Paenibacillus sp. H1-7]
MNVICIGSGYVGSVTAAAFSAAGNHTTVIDVDRHKVDCINGGRSPIYEPGLDLLIQDKAGTLLKATDTYHDVHTADVVFICVGTPSLADGTADLSYVKAAARSIGEHLNAERFTVIVNKSTVPVGTSALVARIIEETSGLKAEEQFAVISNPEFLREGFAIEDLFYPDRIVIGTTNLRARETMKVLYRPFVEKLYHDEEMMRRLPISANKNEHKTVYFETDAKSAELIKYASNAFLAVKISYINEIARLSEALGSNVTDIARGMGLDSRIGEKFLQVSSGWSGSCFPKDTGELLATSQKYGKELTIVKAAVESNQQMNQFCINKIQNKLKSLNGSTIGILGLTFKPDTDDARQTQAMTIIKNLLQFGVRVRVHDPKGMYMFQRLHSELPIDYCNDAEDTADRANALVLLTHWKEYRQLDWNRIYHTMKSPYILDTRNFLPATALREMGFDYEGIGIG